MPMSLPTFEGIPDATAQRILKAFEGRVNPDGTPIPPGKVYRQWLRGQLVAVVREFESQQQATSLEKDLVV